MTRSCNLEGCSTVGSPAKPRHFHSSPSALSKDGSSLIPKLINVQKRDQVTKESHYNIMHSDGGKPSSSSSSYTYFGADNPAMDKVPDGHSCMPGMPDDQVNIILYILLELYSTKSRDEEGEEKTIIIK